MAEQPIYTDAYGNQMYPVITPSGQTRWRVRYSFRSPMFESRGKVGEKFTPWEVASAGAREILNRMLRKGKLWPVEGD